MNELYGIPSRLSTVTTLCKPWEFVAAIPDSAKVDKAAFDKWAKAPSTKHCFYSGFEGVNPHHRVGKDNKAVALLAIIADYDVTGAKQITPEEIASVKDSLPQHLWPTFAHSTFSGGARLVWLLEKPVPVELAPFCRSFMEHVGFKVLRVDRLLPGLDSSAFIESSKLYDVWCEPWQKIGEPIASSLTTQWQVDVGVKMADNVKLFDGEVIPLEEVEKELHRRYPNRWDGPFEVGRRGVVFFDPTSVNTTAAIVTDKGMVCFGQAKMFYSWDDIFGSKFVSSFVQDKVGKVIEHMYFDSKNYWYVDSSGRWGANTKDVTLLRLRNLGLDDERPKKTVNNLSEVEQALSTIHEHHRVEKIVPMVFDKRTYIHEGGYRILNISQVEAMPPAADPQEWGVNFPWLAEFFESAIDDEQRQYFFAWFQWYYSGAYRGEPNKGHAIFFAGPAETGKTFLSNKIVATAMGGHYPATKFLLGETQFNKGPSEAPLWTVDDGTPAQNDSMLNKFSERVKQLVVNGTFEIRAMYRDGVDVNWSGRRLIVTLNDDPVSIRMLPPLDTSIEDKLMFFKIRRPSCTFSQNPEANSQRVRTELPAFLRWLLDWTPPAHVMDARSRLAVRPFVHPELRISSLAANGVSDLLQVIDIWFERRRTEDKDLSSAWEGRAAELLSSFQMDAAVSGLVRKEDVRSIGRKLGLLTSTHSGRVFKKASTSGTGGSAQWRLVAPWVSPELAAETMPDPVEQSVVVAV